jgi:hypothetical protein
MISDFQKYNLFRIFMQNIKKIIKIIICILLNSKLLQINKYVIYCITVFCDFCRKQKSLHFE